MIDERLARRPVLLDTNLVVLLVASRTPATTLAAFKNARHFTTSDASLLASTLKHVSTVVTLAAIAAESSNLLAQGVGGEDRLSTLAATLAVWTEGSVTCAAAAGHARFLQLGFADAAILTVLRARKRLALLTADLQLHLAATQEGLRSVNFNELRDD